MKIDGSCHCGRITYEAEINPHYIVICHCSDCQTISSAPHRVSVVRVAAEDFHLRGTPTTYVKTGRSGNEVQLAFCGNCGSSLYSRGLDSPRFNLRWGAIKQRAQLTPRAQGFCDSAMPWAMDISQIRKIPYPPAP